MVGHVSKPDEPHFELHDHRARASTLGDGMRFFVTLAPRLILKEAVNTAILSRLHAGAATSC